VVRSSALPRAAFAAARAAGEVSRRVGRGAGKTVPGRVALALVPDALHRLAAPYDVVLLSGTNGKTTTTRLLTAAVSATARVVSNSDGANLVSGLVSSLLPPSARAAQIAVLEVDEVALPAALAATEAVLVVLLNLSRDQMDRNSEVASHVVRWSAALATAPQARVVANADDPLVVAAVMGARPSGQGVTWVLVGQPWRSDSAFCPRCHAAWDGRLEAWNCDVCGLRRPDPAWSLVGDELVGATGERHRLDLRLPGRANRANAVTAVAAAQQLGVPVQTALEQVRTVTDVQGRYLQVARGEHDVRLLLAKNPAGWLEALDLVGQDDAPVVLSINAQSADGHDPSWLWDVPYEQLRGRRVVVAGERANDLAVRLHYAGVEHTVELDVLRACDSLPPGPCDLVANYTAFVRARARLTA
jgi:UDP-N-acetylmuramyl tripeptide synthase